MKRILILISIISLFLIFAACTAPISDPMVDTTESSSTSSANMTVPDTTPPSTGAAVQQLPLLAASLPVVTQTEIAEGGTVIFSYTSQSLSLILPDPEVADKIIVDFLNRIDQTASDAESIRNSAINDYKSAKNWNPYLCQVTYDPMRIDSGILSMFGHHVSYSGSAHAGAVYRSVSYDLITGEVLSLDDILSSNTDPNQLCKLILESLVVQREDLGLFDDFESTVSSRFDKNYRQDRDWFFSGDGLCFFFSPYEIGPYSSGAIVANIPYQKLVGILEDSYFPAEKESATGTIFAKHFADTDLDDYSQFAEVVLEEAGNKILLYTDTSVYDVRIETGFLSSDGTTFTQEHTVFAAYALSSGNAIMVDADLTGKQPILRLSYSTNGSTQYRYIMLTSDGKSVQLTVN